MTCRHHRIRFVVWISFILAVSTLVLGGEPRSNHTEASDTTISGKAPAVLVRAIPSADSAYQSLLKPPASRRLRSGYVCLNPGKAGEEHSTEGYEELILILNGRGELQYTNKSVFVEENEISYVPPHTTHYLRNVGLDTLRYIYVVTRVEP
jgi:mannose-6-phosphate isomerase-like protein (cupin superfamily)